MSPRASRTTVPGRRPRKPGGEQPTSVLECQQCTEVAVEVFAPVKAWAEEGAVVLCSECNAGYAVVFLWRFVIPSSPHPMLGSAADGARIRCVGRGELDMSCSRMTLLP